MTQSGKIEVEDEDVAYIYVSASLIYGGRRYITPFKKFVTPMVLPSYVRECPIIGSQTQGGLLQGDIVGKIRRGLESKGYNDREFNCKSTTKVNGMCAYGGECSR